MTESDQALERRESSPPNVTAKPHAHACGHAHGHEEHEHGAEHGHEHHDHGHDHGASSATAKRHGDTCDHAHEHDGHGHDHHGHGHSHAAHDHDHAHSDRHEHAHAHADGDACCAAPAATFAPLPTATAAGGGIKTSMRIMQMDCPTEEALIRAKLGGMSSVTSLDFNLMQRTLTVVHAADALPRVLDALRSLGFVPELAGDATHAPVDTSAGAGRKGWLLAAAALSALISEGTTWFAGPAWLAAAFAGFAIALSGVGTYKKGWIAIRNGKLNINALMSIAVTGAMALGQWPEAAMVMVLFTLAELIEAKSLDRARHAIEGLMQLAPETATVQQPDGSWASVEARTVALGALVRVQPGERIALDGAIVEGRSTVNQAPITGESLPVDKAPGDTVFAGTINEAGSFDYRVGAVAGNTTLARIIHAVEEAQGKRAPTQRFVDRFANVYTPIVFVLAFATAIVPPLVLEGASWRDWIYRALVMLVIACPCALVISTPVTIVSGLAAAARRGILIKGGVYLEEGRKLAWLALDKTGTITRGAPALTDFELRADLDAARCRRLAASLVVRSDHPVSRAIAATVLTLDAEAPHAVSDFEALPGRGVTGVIEGARYWLGNHRLVEELARCSEALEARLDGLERDGKTVVMLLDETRVLALFAVADTVKDTSRAAVVDLHRLGIRTAMLTGDNAHTAQAIALLVGIDDARGDQMPEDKLRAVEELSAGGAVVGMVGDGINDAPALARAGIGFAMGAMGTDAAIETADVALMDDDLRKIPAFVRLSRATYAVLVQNITFALAIKAVFFGLTLAGYGTMWMAVFADAGASLLVVGNGLRLLRR